MSRIISLSLVTECAICKTDVCSIGTTAPAGLLIEGVSICVRCARRIEKWVERSHRLIRPVRRTTHGSGCSFALKVADEMRACIEDTERDRPLRRWWAMLLGYEASDSSSEGQGGGELP